MSAAKKLTAPAEASVTHTFVAHAPVATTRVDTSSRAMLAQLATSPNFNAEAFRMIVDLVRDEQAASAKAAFAAAFPGAQKDFPIIKRGGKAHNGKSYAQLEDILAEVLPVLNRNGFQLFHTQEQPASDAIKIIAILRHCDGHEERNELILPLDTTGNKNAVQARGSTISYGRRYTILPLLGLATEDDDGKAASPAASPKPSDEEIAKLFALMEQTQTEPMSFFVNLLGIPNKDELTADKLAVAMNLMTVKRDTQAKAAAKAAGK